MRVLADAGDAQAKLDELDAKAKELDSDGLHMRFRVDDADGRAQLDELEARAKELGFEDVRIKVRVDGAGRAIADLEAVKHEADSIGGGNGPNKAQSLLGKLFGLGEEGGEGGGPPLSGEGSAGGGIPLIGSLLGPLGLAIVPAIGAALVEVTGLVSGFAAAGAGAVAFGVLAYPAVKHVETAYSDLNTAQQAYQLAQAKYAADPSSTNKTALSTAADNLKAYQEQLAKMPASEQAAVTGIDRLVSGFGKMSRAFEPQAFKVFADGLQIAGKLLPAVTPFADTFATGLDKLLQQVSKFASTPGFKAFLDQLHSIEGPALNSIGDGVGKVAIAFGKLITIMSGKDVAHSINIAFDTVAGAIDGITSVVQHLMNNWDSMSSAATRNAHQVAAAFDGLRHDLAAIFDGIASGVSTAVGSILHSVGSIPGRIQGLFAGAAGWLVQAGRNIIQGLIDGIESMVGSVGSAIGGIASKILGFLPHSPAKEGPLSGSGSPDVSGATFVEMFASGMTSRTGLVAAASSRLAGAAGIAGMGGIGGAGYGGGDHIEINFHGVVGDAHAVGLQVVQAVREFKRNNGGQSTGIG